MRKSKTIFFAFFITVFALVLNNCSSPSFFGGKVQREYFTGGKIRSEFVMSDDTGKNGLLKKYGYDGRITSAAEIRDGMKNGIETWYDKEYRCQVTMTT
jgi:hypothetical protein